MTDLGCGCFLPRGILSAGREQDSGSSHVFWLPAEGGGSWGQAACCSVPPLLEGLEQGVGTIHVVFKKGPAGSSGQDNPGNQQIRGRGVAVTSGLMRKMPDHFQQKAVQGEVSEDTDRSWASLWVPLLGHGHPKIEVVSLLLRSPRPFLM